MVQEEPAKVMVEEQELNEIKSPVNKGGDKSKSLKGSLKNSASKGSFKSNKSQKSETKKQKTIFVQPGQTNPLQMKMFPIRQGY